MEAFWTLTKTIFAPLHVNVNETKHRIDLPTGGTIRCKTAWDADSLRGDSADLLLLEEYAYMNPDAWEKVGAPMLLDNDGEAWFMSTPNRHNHFHSLYINAKNNPRWATFKFTSYDNPYLSRDALNDIVKDMTKDNYRQEILAEFLQNSGAVFTNTGTSIYTPTPLMSTPHTHKGHVIVIGVDLGKLNDYTVFSVMCATCKKELVLYRDRHQRYLYQIDRLKALRDRWHPESIVVERNSMGEVVIEECLRSGIEVLPFMTTMKSKQMIIENLQLQLERGEWEFIDREYANQEMKSYESKLTSSGNIVYAAPSGLHDDVVMARAMAIYRAGRLV